MNWTEPCYSKNQVRKVGNKLVRVMSTDEEGTKEDYRAWATVFHNWRAAHAFPMQIMLDLLRKNAIREDKNAIAVQRLKRVHSILSKLLREKNMNLSRIEDIAGCRVIVLNVKKVNALRTRIKRSRTKHILHRERDYIAKPKKSGYRGIHLIYRYNGGKIAFRGLNVELQIRSKIQHSWATAVEVAGAFTKQAFKASEGQQDWLDFFKYASAEFAKLEGCNFEASLKKVNTFNEFHRLTTKLGVRKKLSAFTVVVKEANKRSQSSGYFLLLLDLENGVINVTQYSSRALDEATKTYGDLEESNKENPFTDVVLVSANSLKELKKAYPNYFSDTDEFQKNMKKVYDANQTLLDNA